MGRKIAYDREVIAGRILSLSPADGNSSQRAAIPTHLSPISTPPAAATRALI
jgi:hypothetical protein